MFVFTGMNTELQSPILAAPAVNCGSSQYWGHALYVGKTVISWLHFGDTFFWTESMMNHTHIHTHQTNNTLLCMQSQDSDGNNRRHIYVLQTLTEASAIRMAGN